MVHVASVEYDGDVSAWSTLVDEDSYRRFQREILWPALDRLMPPTSRSSGDAAPEPFVVLEVTGAGHRSRGVGLIGDGHGGEAGSDAWHRCTPGGTAGIVVHDLHVRSCTTRTRARAGGGQASVARSRTT